MSEQNVEALIEAWKEKMGGNLELETHAILSRMMAEGNVAEQFAAREAMRQIAVALESKHIP